VPQGRARPKPSGRGRDLSRDSEVGTHNTHFGGPVASFVRRAAVRIHCCAGKGAYEPLAFALQQELSHRHRIHTGIAGDGDFGEIGDQRRVGSHGDDAAGDRRREQGRGRTVCWRTHGRIWPACGRQAPAGTKSCSTRPRSDRRDYEVTQRPRFTDLP